MQRTFSVIHQDLSNLHIICYGVARMLAAAPPQNRHGAALSQACPTQGAIQLLVISWHVRMNKIRTNCVPIAEPGHRIALGRAVPHQRRAAPAA